MANRVDELEGVVDLLASVADLDDPELFPAVVLSKIATIVPCDVLTYNDIDLQTQTMRWLAYPADALNPRSGPVLAAYAHEHPLIRHFQTAGDETPRRISDVVSTRAFHALNIYNALFRPAGLEFQLAMTLRTPARRVIGIALNRSSRDFTDRERDVIALLRSPLAASFARLGRRAAAAQALSQTATEDLTERERQVLELAASGRTDKAIGHALGCSERTISKHLQNIYRKLGVTGRVAAVAQIRAAPALA